MEPELASFEGAGGISLVADVWGDPGAWPVLLLHGGGQTRHAWGDTARDLAAAGWRAVSLDLRGHGDSAWAAAGDYAFERFAEDCAAVAGQLGRKPVVVGASLGGIAAILAEGQPDQGVASALVIVDITHRTNPAGVDRIRDFMRSGLEGFATLDEAAAAIAAYTPQRRRAPNLAGLSKVLRRRGGRWHWHWDPDFMRPVEGRPGRADFGPLLEAALSHIRVPTLLVRGLRSDVVTEEGVRDFLERVPGARLADVSEAAHMVAGDRNDAFTRAVVEFLERDVRPRLG